DRLIAGDPELPHLSGTFNQKSLLDMVFGNETVAGDPDQPVAQVGPQPPEGSQEGGTKDGKGKAISDWNLLQPLLQPTAPAALDRTSSPVPHTVPNHPLNQGQNPVSNYPLNQGPHPVQDPLPNPVLNPVLNQPLNPGPHPPSNPSANPLL